ncbi:S-layer homology domain-containing protein [Peptoniphilus asaccharolyticus]|nr:S-layer homology domain-containing protein [Peptoniphilus asaccharolyticus]
MEIHEAYMKGYPDGTIKPQGLVTRAEAAALVARLEKLSLTDTTKSMFKDAEDNAWYTPYINAVVNKNLLLADEDGNIRPNEPITRAEFVRMLAPIDKKNSTASIFADIKGHKFEAEINQEFGNKVIEGYEDGTFRPEGKITRAETTAMLNRKYDRVADADGMVMDYKAKIAKFTDLDESSWYYFEMIDATNTHKLTRRDTKDKYGRTNTIWKEIIKEDVK